MASSFTMPVPTSPRFHRAGLIEGRLIYRVSIIVKANDGESFESMLKRFNRRVQQDGVLSEARRRVRFQRPRTRQSRKQIAARRSAVKATRAST
jgi:small subunit ribosomal protein S21